MSPINGDHAGAFPPTLVQVGPRELLLSSAVNTARFQALLPTSPKTRTAIARGAAFFAARLKR